jgi:hypothetical protein
LAVLILITNLALPRLFAWCHNPWGCKTVRELQKLLHHLVGAVE